MAMQALPLGAALCLCMTGCVREVIVEKPVPVEVVRIERVTVPPELLHGEHPETLPEALSFAQALELWALDRQHLQTLNGRLRAIQALQ